MSRPVLRQSRVITLNAIIIFLAFLAVGLLRGRRSASSLTCRSCIFRLQYAIRELSVEYDGLPRPAGYSKEAERNVSWREIVIEWIDGRPVAEVYSRKTPRDIRSSVMHFQCGSDYRTKDLHTDYFAVVGERTLWSDRARPHYLTLIKEVEKIVLVEVPNGDVPWHAPHDVTVDEVITMWRDKARWHTWWRHRGVHFITTAAVTAFSPNSIRPNRSARCSN